MLFHCYLYRDLTSLLNESFIFYATPLYQMMQTILRSLIHTHDSSDNLCFVSYLNIRWSLFNQLVRNIEPRNKKVLYDQDNMAILVAHSCTPY